MKTPKHFIFGFLVLLVASFNLQCKDNEKKEDSIPEQESTTEELMIEKSEFGTTRDRMAIEQYTLRNANGMEMDVITYGGRITSLKVPNKDGEIENVVLGFDNIEDYQKENPFFGALIGRFGNRIAKGKFSLDGTEYSLATNNAPNHLHGGKKGFDQVVWKAEPMETSEGPSITLSYTSEDGEEGYPGKLDVTVVYTLTDDNTLEVSYDAETDQPTIINLTQHAYFNLTGDFSKDILSHKVEINADSFLPVDATLIPTGDIKSVEGTPFDFREPKQIGGAIDADNEQLKRGLGYDHCWVLNGNAGTMRMVASAYDPTSGRMMEVFSEEPGIQFYTGNFLDGTLPNPDGGNYEHRTGFCLETQHYPDAPNQDNFPSVVLRPGEVYSTQTNFKFSVK